MQSLFVYYKLPASEHAATLKLVQAFQQRMLQSWPGLTIELMQRPVASAESMETWMEVYRHPEGVSDLIISDSSQQALEMGLPPKRVVEVFIQIRT